MQQNVLFYSPLLARMHLLHQFQVILIGLCCDGLAMFWETDHQIFKQIVLVLGRLSEEQLSQPKESYISNQHAQSIFHQHKCTWSRKRLHFILLNKQTNCNKCQTVQAADHQLIHFCIFFTLPICARCFTSALFPLLK